MKAPSPLQSHFDAGRHFLIIAGGEVYMSNQRTAIRKTDAIVAQIVDIRSLWAKLPLLVDGRSRFTKAELAIAAGQRPADIDQLIASGLIGGNGTRRQKFSYVELFTVALAGALRRAGVSPEGIAEAAAVVRGEVPQEVLL